MSKYQLWVKFHNQDAAKPQGKQDWYLAKESDDALEVLHHQHQIGDESFITKRVFLSVTEDEERTW